MRVKFVEKLLTVVFFVAIMGSYYVRAEDPWIVFYDYTGELMFIETDRASRYVIEGCDELGGPWTNEWDSLNNLASTGEYGFVSCSIPVNPAEPKKFYRVVSMYDEASVPEGMELIFDGPFDMGDSFGESSADELPVHTVDLTTYYMDKTEVSWEKWQEVYDWAVSNGYQFDNTGAGKDDDHPVHSVSWYDCLKWCNARSEMEGLEPCYYIDNGWYDTFYRRYTEDPVCNWFATGYRLPTEAEWEKAARGGLSGNRFPLGDTIVHSNANYYVQHDKGVIEYSYDLGVEVGYHPDYYGDGFPYTSPVGSFTNNAYGLCDMDGNVYEWCWDKYNDDYYAESDVENPTGSAGGFYHVYRGGCWDHDAERSRNSNRNYLWPGSYDIRIGFRCVMGTQDVPFMWYAWWEMYE